MEAVLLKSDIKFLAQVANLMKSEQSPKLQSLIKAIMLRIKAINKG